MGRESLLGCFVGCPSCRSGNSDEDLCLGVVGFNAMLVLDYEDLLAWSRAAEARRRRREQHQKAAESVLGAADQELLEKARNDEDLEIAGEGTEASAAVQGIVKTGENEKLDMGQVCMEAVGPSGQGFIAVRGVRGYDSLRGRLLPLARKLALMPNVRRLAVLKVLPLLLAQLQVHAFISAFGSQFC